MLCAYILFPNIFFQSFPNQVDQHLIKGSFSQVLFYVIKSFSFWTEPSSDGFNRFIDFEDIKKEMTEGRQMYPFAK